MKKTAKETLVTFLNNFLVVLIKKHHEHYFSSMTHGSPLASEQKTLVIRKLTLFLKKMYFYVRTKPPGCV